MVAALLLLPLGEGTIGAPGGGAMETGTTTGAAAGCGAAVDRVTGAGMSITLAKPSAPTGRIETAVRPIAAGAGRGE